MIFALLNIASDITLNIAWWTTKAFIGGIYNSAIYFINNKNIIDEQNLNNEKIAILMNKIDILQENIDNILQDKDKNNVETTIK